MKKIILSIIALLFCLGVNAQVKEGAGGYIYQLNPDDSVTIIHDPTGRANGARLKKGGRQQVAYNAILAKEFGKSPAVKKAVEANPVGVSKASQVMGDVGEGSDIGESDNSLEPLDLGESDQGEVESHWTQEPMYKLYSNWKKKQDANSRAAYERQLAQDRQDFMDWKNSQESDNS